MEKVAILGVFVCVNGIDVKGSEKLAEGGVKTWENEKESKGRKKVLKNQQISMAWREKEK